MLFSVTKQKSIFIIQLAARFYSRRYARGGRFLPSEFLGKYDQKIENEEFAKLRSKILSNVCNPNEFATETPKLNTNNNLNQKTVHNFSIKRFSPEFMPYRELDQRDELCEALERRDMVRRRKHIDIPEFHVGSIIAVTVADPHAPNKSNRFVGICIERTNSGLFSKFLLRNIVENVAVEVEYHLYGMKIQKIELLKMQRSLDKNMWYLRDAPYECSRCAFDMTPVPYSPNDPIPIITEKISLFPPPWHFKWYLYGYKGINEESIYSHLTDEQLADIDKLVNHVDRYDLMKLYRQESSVEEFEGINSYVESQFIAIEEFKQKKKEAEIAQYKSQRKMA